MIDKEYLEYHYLDLIESTHVIARQLGVHQATVYYWIKKYGIKTRPISANRLPSGAYAKRDAKCWKGCGVVSSTYFTHLKHGAKARNIPFDITIESLNCVKK